MSRERIVRDILELMQDCKQQSDLLLNASRPLGSDTNIQLLTKKQDLAWLHDRWQWILEEAIDREQERDQ